MKDLFNDRRNFDAEVKEDLRTLATEAVRRGFKHANLGAGGNEGRIGDDKKRPLVVVRKTEVCFSSRFQVDARFRRNGGVICGLTGLRYQVEDPRGTKCWELSIWPGMPGALQFLEAADDDAQRWIDSERDWQCPRCVDSVEVYRDLRVPDDQIPLGMLESCGRRCGFRCSKCYFRWGSKDLPMPRIRSCEIRILKESTCKRCHNSPMVLDGGSKGLFCANCLRRRCGGLELAKKLMGDEPAREDVI